MKIGFIGLGTMGVGMVNNLKSEFDVTVYNRTKSKTDGISRINVVDHPIKLGSNDIIFTCVSNDDALKEVLFGENGLFNGNIENKIIVDCSTTSINLTEKVKKECDKVNAFFLDAPITGSKLGAQNGTMMFMVGGEKKTFERVLPVFGVMGKTYVYCGKTPNGQKAKHALNLTISLTLQSYFEGLTLGVAHGVPYKAMNEVLQNSATASGLSKFKMPYIEKRDFDQHFTLKLMNKDLGLAKEDIKNLGLELPLASKIKEVFDKAMDRPDEDFITIVKTLENENNVKFKN